MTWGKPCGSIAACTLALLIAACGTPGPPQPPSLNLPDRVGDLTATRVGNHVELAWTMPRRNTDRLALRGPIAVHVCRTEAPSAPCVPVADTHAEPAGQGTFSDALPPALSSGPPRPLRYFVELRNPHGRSAGTSNPAIVLAGQPPPSVTNISAKVHKSGIVVEWQAATPGTSVRLDRTLVSAPAPRQATDMLAPPAEPAQQHLLVLDDPGRALDRSISFGQTYEYRLQRIVRISVDGQTQELPGELSSPVRVQASDEFPPSVPAGLVAVSVSPQEGAAAFVDLNWQQATDPDLAGYLVYRRADSGAWQRVSGDQPIPAPAFHDTAVQPGHTYTYAVTAIDRSGHESARSPEARETIPQP